MKINSHIVLALVFGFILSFTVSCSKEDIASESNIPTLAAGGGACTVSGPNAYWHAWLSPMETVLNDCHLESLDRNCIWWTPSTTVSVQNVFDWELYSVSATLANLRIGTLANWADANRPSNSFLITHYELTYISLGNGYANVKLVVTYRRKICQVKAVK